MYENSSLFTLASRRSAALLSVALFIATVGCKSKPSAAPPDDATLLQSVQTKLSSDTSLGNEPIQASVQQGVATLDGAVSSEAARGLAANDAAQVTGIRTVVNNLTVQPSAALSVPPPPPIKPEPPTGRHKPSAVTPPRVVPAPAPAPAPPAQQAEAAPAPIERETPPPPAPKPPPPPPTPVVRSITLDSGTTIPIRITQTLDSATTQQGDTFSGVLASDILSDNLVVLPQGTPVSGRVTTVQEAAHFKGNSLLTIELSSVDRKGDHIAVTTDPFSKAGNGRGKNTAEKVGGGAAVGAILGGILGGGKGAAIGAAAGGGAGAGVQAVTKGQQVQIESETLIRFHLANPITVRVSTGNQAHSNESDADLQRHQ